MRRFLSMALTVALALAVLPGCASKYGEKKVTTNYYPACYKPIQDLRDREHDVAKGTVGGAAIGALGGALLGFLASGGKAEGALTGAVAGGVTGAVAGNLYARKQKEADDNRRLASYLQDIDGDISGLDIDSAAARTSLQCYDKQFNVLITEIKEKRISRLAAEQRYGEISAGREEAILIMGDLITRGQNLDREYEQAFLNEEQSFEAPAKSQQVRRVSKRQATAALKPARQRQTVLKQKVSDIQKERTQAQTATSQQQQLLAESLSALDSAKS